MPFKKIEAIVFDFGGVMVTNLFPILVRELADSFGVSQEQVKEGLKNEAIRDFGKGEISESEFWKRFSKFLNKPIPKNHKDLLIEYYKKYSKMDERMKKLVLYLKSQGYKTAVLSNTIPPHMNFNLKRKRFEIFDVKILSPEVHHLKPEKEIFEEALKRLKVSPQETVYIDNKKEYVEAAKKLGINALVFTNYEKLLRDLREMHIHLNGLHR